MEYHVYILECSDRSFYTGITDNLELRLKEHNGELVGGAKYTRSRRPVKLRHFEPFETRQEAEKREREVKKMSRAEKEIIIEKWKVS
ncbi:MAG: GIY-YIG nuclease family protein [Patescibacteria group bacterium]